MKHAISIVAAAISWTWIGMPGRALAHRDDYLDETFVYVTLERGEIEPEYWFDVGDHVHHAGDFVRHNVATEYGCTDRWMVDGRLTFQDDRGAAIRVSSGRIETRYRFAEEGSHPVDVALSAELAGERTEDGDNEWDIEPRFVLSRDFRLFNCTLNLVEEIPAGAGHPGFVPSAGFRYGTAGILRLGSEVKYETESSRGTVVPQVWFAFEHELTLKLGFSHGFGRNREDFARFALEVGL